MEVGYVCVYLATLTGNAAVVVACGLVATHHARLILLQVAGDVPWHTKRAHQPIHRQTLDSPRSMHFHPLTTCPTRWQ